MQALKLSLLFAFLSLILLSSFSSFFFHTIHTIKISLYHRLTQPQHIHLCRSTPLRRTLFTDHYLRIHYLQQSVMFMPWDITVADAGVVKTRAIPTPNFPKSKK